MAKIFISYSTLDREWVSMLSMQLNAHGHEITSDIEALAAGQDWRKVLQEGLKASEVFIVVISAASQESPNVMSELGAARAYASAGESMLILPVVLDKLKVPNVLADIQCIVGERVELPRILEEIDKAIAVFLGKQSAIEKAEEKDTARIQANSAEFIDEAVRSLSEVAARNRWAGRFWYFAGFLCLVGGVGVAFLVLYQSGTASDPSWPKLAYISLKSLVVVALLAAASKYAFSLGKSYTSEELKASDRLHAISFGRFYLRVYGSAVKWSELKEAFQHWNIDRRSSFSELDVSHIDPKLSDAVVEIAKAVVSATTQKEKDKKP